MKKRPRFYVAITHGFTVTNHAYPTYSVEAGVLDRMNASRIHQRIIKSAGKPRNADPGGDCGRGS